jgi:malonyl CoA-acyl carrier protein transacylase
VDAFVFPGQGSQKIGMGANLFDEVEEFKTTESEIDEILGYSIRKLCLEDSEKKLNSTAFTQPALYVVNALHYFKALSTGLRPRLLAGHSLGEYNALLAAGVFDFVTGVRLVQKRGELMGQARDGGMAAVLGVPADRLTQMIQENHLTGIDVANFNSPNQTVISGQVEEIKLAGALLEKAGVDKFFPLPVSAAFHSRYMASAAAEFGDFLSGFTFNEPSLPVIANTTARPYKKGDPAATVRDLLVKQISSPVQWNHTILYLMGRGATKFHEIGPGNVLSKLIQQIRQ